MCQSLDSLLVSKPGLFAVYDRAIYGGVTLGLFSAVQWRGRQKGGLFQSIMEAAMEKTLLRVGEAADFLAVSRWTIYRWVEEGKLRGTKIGKGSLRIFHESIADLVQDNQVDCGAALSSATRSREQ